MVSYKINGKTVTQEEFQAEPSKLEELLEAGEVLPAQTPSCWPMTSTALQVHPRQIPAVMERNRRHGLSVEYLPNGQSNLSDRGKRRDLLRIEKMHDHNGGYGD